MPDSPMQLKATVRQERGRACRWCEHVHTYWRVWYLWHTADGAFQHLAGRDEFHDWATALKVAIGTVEVTNRAR